MFKFYICLCLLELVAGSPLGKIFGGKLGSIEDYPFLVNLRSNGEFRCGGSLISPKCVLTAAHCLERREQYFGDLTVHAHQQCLGDTSPLENVRTVSFASRSPNYCPCSFDSDIAVIQLSRPFDIASNDSLVRIDFNNLPDRSNLTIVGWGMTNNWNVDYNQCLQVAQVLSLTPKECSNTIGRLHPITNTMFCAIGENGIDACPGDSGGPIFQGNQQQGLVSWGYGCGSGYPGVYTQISSPQISSFVKDFIHKHC